ncbi:MAG: acetyl-CoA carboxylase biotin carboxyl carrier protein subunit, partial [Muribaculaceae bacterium]|nr:acetyl-CoA carboxylase biotin carboxyl carrier protein subunit [Muribaculaceae bacterium]
ATDQVAVLEAMKMENSIRAGVDGTVKSIDVNKGDSVLEGTVLITIA